MKIIIKYNEDYKKSILIAFSNIKEFTNISLPEIKELLEYYRNGNDISCEIPKESIKDVKYYMDSDGFEYRFEE